MTIRSAALEDEPGFDVVRVICLASVVAWGVFAGTRVLNIPLMQWWQTMEPQDFVAWFHDNQPRFNGLLFPLGAITGLCSIAALLTAWPWPSVSPRRRFWLGLAAMCWLVILALNPLFYDHANQVLATPGALTDDEVRATLRQWVAAQWLRTVLSIIGLVAAAAGLSATASERRARHLAELA
jgi:hypothetical protein